MPFLDLPDRQLRMYYTINPRGKAAQSWHVHTSEPPQSTPLAEGKPVIVFIHLTYCSSESFIGQMSDDRLTSKFNLVFFDSRHHGRTTEVPSRKHPHEPRTTLQEYCDDHEAGIKALGLQKFALVGEGFHGGRIVVELAARMADKVQAMLLSTPGNLEELPEVKQMMLKDFMDGFESNKNGKGDGTGEVPMPIVHVVQDALLGVRRIRLPEREQNYLNYFQTRCLSFPHTTTLQYFNDLLCKPRGW
ncbi:hypothetical protein T439DRAFT_176602 [Meredithblackwellia eburnea MCA 4105]